MLREEKDKINVLTHVKSFFGTHQSRSGPLIKYMIVIAIPIFLYVTVLLHVISWKIFLVIELLFAFRMYLKIMLREKERMEAWRKVVNNEAGTINSLVRVTPPREDGMLEFSNGQVVYIISAFTMTYADDNKLSVDLEAFLKELSGYMYDIVCHLVVKEKELQDFISNMDVYSDTEMIKERMLFYMKQDEYCEHNAKLFRINIIVKTAKYDAKMLKGVLDALVTSYTASVFKLCSICNGRQVNDVLSRDVCAYVNITEMLKKKYTVDEYYGSKVLYYGDEIPEKFTGKEETCNFTDGRIREGESQ